MDSYQGIAISPDGTHIAYVAAHDGVEQIYLRDTAEFSARPVAGTANGHTPFFSPDGQWLGAVVGQNLVKIPLAGGSPVALANLQFKVYGACWPGDQWIYLGSETPLGLIKVPVTGGTVLGASLPDDDHGETDHRFPEVLPGAQWILFTGRHARQNYDETAIYAISLKNAQRKEILKSAANARYVSSGHLTFLRGGVLMAVAFDPITLQVKGEPAPVVQGVMENSAVGVGQYSVSADGTLVYLQAGGTPGERELVSVDRNGAAHSISSTKRPYQELALSPDGRTLATTITSPASEIWLHDMARGTETAFTSGGEHRSPAWSADGKLLAYAAYSGKADEQFVIARIPVDGSGKEQSLMTSETPVRPWFYSPDGRVLIYQEFGRSAKHSSYMMSTTNSYSRGHMNQRDFEEDWAQVSPDSHWVAYDSEESGQMEVYVVAFPGLKGKIKVSTEGGRHPQWSPNGKELYFEALPRTDAPRPFAQRFRLMAASVETSPTFTAGAPHMLLEGPYREGDHDYAVTPDGKGFLFIRENQPPAGAELKVVLNWTDELKRRLPTR